MEEGELPGRSHSEDGAEAGGSAMCCRPIESAGCVADQTCHRVGPIRRVSEVVQHGLLAGGVNLEYCSSIGSAAVVGNPINVSGCIPDQSSVGISSVGPGKTVQHGCCARRVNLEHGSQVRVSALRGCSVKISSRIPPDARNWIRTIGPTREAMQHLIGPIQVQFEHGAVI